MKQIKIFILLILAAIFVQCQEEDPKTQVEKDNETLLEMSKYIAEKDEGFTYYKCETAKDSAETEARTLSYYFNEIGGNVKYDSKLFLTIYDLTREKEDLEKDRRVLTVLAVFFIIVIIILLLFVYIGNISKSAYKSFIFVILFVLASFVYVYMGSDTSKEEIKELSMYEYFINSS